MSDTNRPQDEGVLSSVYGHDIITEHGELLTFEDAIPWKPAHILGPNEVAVTRDQAKTIVRELFRLGSMNLASELKSLITKNTDAMEAENGE